MTQNTASTPVQQPGSPPVIDEPPMAKIVTTKVREKMVPLEFPVEFYGKLYEEIRVHRVTGTEIKDYVEKLGTPDASPFPPSIDCPVPVWEAMDADDVDAVAEASMDFMPRRMKAAADRTQSSGDSTSAS